MAPPTIDDDSVFELLVEQGLIGAVRELRSRGWTFTDAAARVQAVDPDAEFRNRGHEPSEVEPIPEHEPFPGGLRPLRMILERIETTLFGWNYSLTVDTRGLRCSPEIDCPLRVLRTLYPESAPSELNLVPLPLGQVLRRIADACSYRGDEGSHPPDGGPETVVAKDTPQLEGLLRDLVSRGDYESYSYESGRGVPGYWVFWHFCFLFYDRDRGLAFSVSAVASD